MNTHKFFAILFAFFALSGLKEIYYIMNSEAKSFTPVAIILTGGMVWLSLFFWKRGNRPKF